MSAPAKLAVERVAHRFPGGAEALAEADLAVAPGEFVSLVGPSGCGKSTLFNIVAGLIRPTAGRVLLDGKDVTGTTGQVGYMLQNDLLLPWRTVLDNVVLGRVVRHGRARRSDRAEALELIDRYGLGGFADHYPHALSGGMRQRVALMRTLLFARDVLLLDEPFGALDSQTRLLMQEWLLEVWAEVGSTVLFITHDVDEAIYLADRVVVFSARPGRIKGIFDIPFARPRAPELVMGDPFVSLKREVFAEIYAESVRAAHERDAIEAVP
jgi:ABC-type nitrate/sulfonate/bicarbonate transport system ATPase subunit